MSGEVLLYFQEIRPDKDLLNEVFKFDVNRLEQVNDLTISKYGIVLSQFLIYYKYQLNKVRADIFKKQRILDAGINYNLTKEYLKKYKTKIEATTAMILENCEFSRIKDEIDTYKEELILLEGIDKAISEYIAMLKRELTRRENELQETRYSRR